MKSSTRRCRSMPMAIAWRTSSLSNGANLLLKPRYMTFRPSRDLELQVGVGLDGLEVGAADVVDAIDGAGLELDEPLGGLRAPADDQLLGLGLLAPVAVVAGEGDIGAAVPGFELVRAGAVDFGHDGLVGRAGRIDMRFEPAGVVDAERREGDLREERHVRVAELEHDGLRVGGADLLEVAGVGEMRGIRRLGLAARGLAGLRVGHGGERRAALGGGARRGRGAAVDGAADGVVPVQAAKTIAADAARAASRGDHLRDRVMLFDSSSVPPSRTVLPPCPGSWSVAATTRHHSRCARVPEH